MQSLDRYIEEGRIHSFPASHENYKECMHILGLDVNDINALRADSIIVTNKHLPNEIPALNHNLNLNELNLVAYMLAVDEVHLYRIEAFLTSTHAPRNTTDLINTLYNLDDYELVSAETYEELAIMAADEWDLADSNEPGFDATVFGHDVSESMDGPSRIMVLFYIPNSAIHYISEIRTI